MCFFLDSQDNGMVVTEAFPVDGQPRLFWSETHGFAPITHTANDEGQVGIGCFFPDKGRAALPTINSTSGYATLEAPDMRRWIAQGLAAQSADLIFQSFDVTN